MKVLFYRFCNNNGSLLANFHSGFNTKDCNNVYMKLEVENGYYENNLRVFYVYTSHHFLFPHIHHFVPLKQDGKNVLA